MHGVSSISETGKPKALEIGKGSNVMRRYCRDVNITDLIFIQRCIYLWMQHKKNRRDVRRFLTYYSDYTYAEICTMMDAEDYSILEETVERIAEDVQRRIISRKLDLPPIRFKNSYDQVAGKWRTIGIQKPIHQVFDYVAVEACKKMFMAKIGPYQMASISERGQDKGARAILKWMQLDESHTRYYGQMDIRKCYPSIPHNQIKTRFARDIKNETLIWLICELIDAFPQGLSIGSYFSQFACNYYLSKAWHYAMEELCKIRKKRDGSIERVRLIYHSLFFMDDILFLGASEKDIRKAIECFADFVYKELGLEIKPGWILRRADYIGKDGEHHGHYIDIMGRRIYRDHITIRRKTYKRIRRTILRAKVYVDAGNPMPLKLAHRVTSHGGHFDHTDSWKCQDKYNVPKIRYEAEKVVAADGRAAANHKRRLQDVYRESPLAKRAKRDRDLYVARKRTERSVVTEEYPENNDCPF